MVIDASTRPVADGELIGAALSRDEVMGTPRAQAAFDIVDAICLQDPRIAEVLGGGQGG
jgi:hypothetical protein